ncbi:MAG: hypothetical protein OEZ01_15990 [Candidatus Heimdallarchaeota archaeon]|nr:hypothetical protein [Candidatus Heimdallarchaeota archaeon]
MAVKDGVHYETDDGLWYDLLMKKCISEIGRWWMYDYHQQMLLKHLVKLELHKRGYDVKNKKIMIINRYK